MLTYSDQQARAFGEVKSNHDSGIYKEHNAKYYVPKSSSLLTGSGVWLINSVACGFSSIKIDYYDYQKSLISRRNDVYVFFNNFIEKKYKLHL